MSSTAILQFIFATFLPVAVAAFFVMAKNRRWFTSLSYWPQQIIIGIAFGGVAVFGTEFGIDTVDAVMNVRDAAPIVGGLVFGGPAGIIAGVIGGAERWFSVLWGRGEFTQLACSIATVAVGFYAAGLRKLFDHKIPTPLLALALGSIAEVMHLMLIFFTNVSQPERAIIVVRACSLPMIIANGVAVMLSIIVVSLLQKQDPRKPASEISVSQLMQTGMIIPIFLGILFTTGFTYLLQSGVAREEAERIFSIYLNDVQSEIETASNNALLATTHEVAREVGSVEASKSMDLTAMAKNYAVTEIDVVNSEGIIENSNFTSFVGFDMASGEQSSEFLVLLEGNQKELVQSLQPMAYNNTDWRKYAGVAIEGGFVQVAYGVSAFQNSLASQIKSMATNRHVGTTGSVVIFDASGTVVSSIWNKFNGETVESSGMGHILEFKKQDTPFEVTFMGVPMVAMYEVVDGYTLMAMLPAAETNFSRDAAVLVSSFMVALVFALVFIVLFWYMKWLVVDSLHSVNKTLGDITDGKLEAKVEVRTNKEFSDLSDDINQTVDALKDAIDEAAARIDAELVYARTIQHSALPSVFPPFPMYDEFEIFASMNAAKEVGGDFYDFYFLDDYHLAFLIADVSGKGIPGALFMMTAKTLIKSLAESGLPVNEVLSHANDQLCANNEAEMFVTCWMGVLDVRTGHVVFGNAGHNPPAIQHKGGEYAYYVVRPNFVLAGMEGIPYRSYELDLQPGDTIFLYTDGVTEATSATLELFGEERLIDSLNRCKDADVESICKDVHADVDAFVGDAPQFDDMTMLTLRYLGGSTS